MAERQLCCRPRDNLSKLEKLEIWKLPELRGSNPVGNFKLYLYLFSIQTESSEKCTESRRTKVQIWHILTCGVNKEYWPRILLTFICVELKRTILFNNLKHRNYWLLKYCMKNSNNNGKILQLIAETFKFYSLRIKYML